MISQENRFEAFSALMKEVDEVARLAGPMPELTERLNHGAQGFMLVAPSGKDAMTSFYVSSPQVNGNSLKIYPSFSGDEELLSTLRSSYLIHDDQYGVYTSEKNLMALSMDSDETIRAMASFFIHELGHVLAAIKTGRVMIKKEESLQERIAEEMSMRTFDYKLLLAIGGPEYRRASEFMAQKIAYSKLNKKRMPLIKGTGVALNSCLGIPRSAAVEEKRDHWFWLSSELLAIDTNLQPNEAWIEKMKLGAQYVK